ncbi:MAG: DUF4328 domain-containing protein [Dehalococcoidia bacterium]
MPQARPLESPHHFDSYGSTPNPYQSLAAPGWIVTALLVGFAAITAWSIIAGFAQISLVNDLEAGHRVTLGEASAADENYQNANLAQLLVYLFIAAFFIWWLVRATKNVEAFGVRDADYGPGWAMGGWFIPILNFWRPLQVVNQAWRASASHLPGFSGEDYRGLDVSPLLYVWWISFCVISVVGNGLDSATENAESLGDLRGALQFGIASDIAFLALTAMTIVVVRRLTSRHGIAARSLEQVMTQR